MTELTPKEIVAELDRHIIGQDAAKRKVAIALRNRWRRQQLDDELRDEIVPKNIIMIGPTGVGKTEIARRLAKMVDAPFVKVEASKFTEVGYVGRDCESMIRELTEVAIALVRAEMEKEVADKAKSNAEERLLDLLLPPQPAKPQRVYRPADPGSGDEPAALEPVQVDGQAKAREVIQRKLRAGELDDRTIEIDLKETGNTSMMQVFSNSGLEEMGVNLQDMLGKFMPQRSAKRKTTVNEARRLLEQEELANLIDMDAVVRIAIERAENSGMVFLDEIDKIAGRTSGGSGPDISREGVQRDILPIVEGSTVATKYGSVKTDHILFIAAGAFHMTKVSDLIPELQGRFPIRVELDSLEAKDLARILLEPKASLIKQYQAMLETEGVTIKFSDVAVDAIARICQRVNEESENIGARRLHTVMECLLEDLLYDSEPKQGQTVEFSAEDVESKLSDIAEKQDLARYIL
jgi:ATP-dependent HslUV protease ATP-binding subunit HslU